MKPYTVIPHTADIGLEVRGGTLGALFRNASLGLLALFERRGKVRPRETISLRVRASSPEALLVNWLGEIIYLVSAKRWFPCRVEIDKISETNLSGRLSGGSMKDSARGARRDSGTWPPPQSSGDQRSPRGGPPSGWGTRGAVPAGARDSGTWGTRGAVPRCRITREVKGVTFHNLKIVREGKHLKTRIIFDV